VVSPFLTQGSLNACTCITILPEVPHLEQHAQYRFVRGQLQRAKKPQQIRGLNRNHNHEMKEIFKAAARASCGVGPLRDFYVALLAKGMKPEMARLTLARKIAAIALTLWKRRNVSTPNN